MSEDARFGLDSHGLHRACETSIMGQEDDAAAQRARAADLRAQIARITGKTPADDDSSAAPADERPPSPREFIEEKMRELRDRKP